jgi:hypothetical protein
MKVTVFANIQQAAVRGPRKTAQDDLRGSGIIKRGLPFVIPEMLKELR